MPELRWSLESNRYQLIRPLGYGGAGEVYLVFDRRREKEVALKLLRGSGHRSQERFKREFRAVADIDHPNIVRLYELGSSADGGLFYTMEYVAGPTLDALLSSAAPPSGSSLLTILVGVLEALFFLHSAKRAHCDIKPSNVMVSSGVAKLLDFGIARDLGDAAATGQSHGTPQYMSPEQINGEVSVASDMYSFGCILYEILAGRPVFLGGSAEVLQRHLTQLPAPPSVHRRCDLLLEEVCLALLSKDPVHRPSAEGVLWRLHRGLNAPEPLLCRFERPASSLFIGRQAELRELREARASSDKAPCLVLLDGASGFGKSALLDEFGCLCQEEGYQIWQGHCDARESIPYNAFDEILEQLCARLEAGLYMEPDEDTPALLRVFQSLRGTSLARGLTVSTSGDPLTERRRAMRSLLRLLSLASSPKPPILLIDDLQFADAESLEVLRWVLSSEEAPPSLLVCTAQDAVLLARLGGGARVRRLSLSVTSDEEMIQVLRAQNYSLLEEELRQIAIRSQGNILLALEAARAHRQEPKASLGEVLSQKIDALAPEERRLLELLAASDELSFSLLLSISGLGSKALSEGLDALQRAALIRASSGAAEMYQSRSRVISQVVLEQMEAARRVALYRDLAEQIEASNGAARAIHFWRLAERPERLSAAALAAAKEVEESLAFEHAAELYTLARAYQSPWAVTHAHAVVLRKAGRYRDAAVLFEELSSIAPAEAGQDARLLALNSYLAAGDFAKGLGGFASYLQETSAALPSSLFFKILMMLWGFVWLSLAWRRYDLESLLAKPQRAKPTELLTLRAYESMHFHLLALDPISATCLGVRHSRLSLSVRDLSHVGRARISYALQVIGIWGNLRLDDALRHIYHGEALCMAANDKQGLLHALYARGLVNLYEGNWGGVKDAASRGNALARQEGLFGEPALMELQNFYFASLYLSGSFAALQHEATAHLAEAEARGNVVERADPLLLCGLVSLAQNKGEIGRRYISEALSLTPAQPMTMLRLRVELLSLELELFDRAPERGLSRLADISRRWRESGIFGATVEYSLFQLQKAKLKSLYSEINHKKSEHVISTPPLSSRVIPISMQDEHYRLEASKSHKAKRYRRAFQLINHSLSIAERRNNKYGMGIAYAARATIQRKLGLPGAENDRARASSLLRELEISSCYILAIEGWEDPTLT